MRRYALLVLAVMTATALGLGAGTLITSPGAAPSDPGSNDAMGPQHGSDSVEQQADDPAGGPRWAVRVYEARDGRTCPELGRVSNGRFGQVDGSRFVETPPGPQGSCGSLATDRALIVANRYPALGGDPARTVIFGVVRPDVARITVTVEGDAVELEPGGRGTFLAVYPALLDPADIIVATTGANGEQTSHSMGA